MLFSGCGKEEEAGGDDVYYIRDFREDDSSTEVLVERNGSYLWIFYGSKLRKVFTYVEDFFII